MNDKNLGDSLIVVHISVVHDAAIISYYVVLNMDDSCFGKDLAGRGYGLIEVLPWFLPGGTDDHE